MENPQKHIADISEIRNMMERASKFISLSGLSGISAGTIALLGSMIAYWYLHIYLPTASVPLIFKSFGVTGSSIALLFILASIIFCFAFLSAVFFTTRNSKKKNIPIWDINTRRLLFNLIFPLLIGAIFIVLLVKNGFYILIIPSSLIFYGFALIHSGNFTYSDIKFLGYIEIILGILALLFVEFGLFIWALGFGFFHIVYGIIMYFKYEK